MVRHKDDLLSPFELCPPVKSVPVSLVPTDGYPDIKMNVKFVQDTSKFWYKPDISREQGETRTSGSLSRQICSQEWNDSSMRSSFLSSYPLFVLFKPSTSILSLLPPPSFSHQSVEGQRARGLHHTGQPFLPRSIRPGHEGGLPAPHRPTEQKRSPFLNLLSADTNS